MDKLKAAAKLKEKGYNASGSDGIVIIRYEPGTYEETREKIIEFLQEIKYDASWGLVCNRKSKSTETSSEQENTENIPAPTP